MTTKLYGALGGSATTSDLYLVDPITAAVTSIGPLGVALTAMAWDPVRGVMFGGTNNNSAASPLCLGAVDLDTGAWTLVGPFGVGSPMIDFACDSAGNLYGVSGAGGYLHRIDKDTGAATQINPFFSGCCMYGATEFDLDGVLWQIENDDTSLSEVIPATGMFGPGFVDVSGFHITFGEFDALTTHPRSGLGYGFDKRLTGRPGGPLCHLVTLNYGTGVITDIGAVSASPPFDAIAFGPPSGPPRPSRRFFAGYLWRFAVLRTSDLKIETILDHWATGRTITFEENTPTQIQCVVPSESPEVYITDADDGDPFVAEGTRILLALRREDPVGGPPYVPRAAGIISQPTDDARGDAGAGNAYTSLVAFDGWQTLYRRPIRFADGSRPGIDGMHVPLGTNPVDLIVDQITRTETYDGPTLIDYTTGHLGPVPNLPHDLDLPHGMSVGELWKQLCDDGYVDVRLDAVYDVANLKMWTLNVYEQEGSDRYEAQFAWNLPGRSLVGLSRLKDGLERGNKIQFYNGQGGPAVTLQTDAPSVAKYGPYWYQAFYPTETVAFQVEARAQAELAARKDGLFTITANPAPERSPIPLLEYGLGDNVVVAAAAAGFRETMIGLWRVTKIPIQVSDNGIETVAQLEVSTTVPAP